MNNALIKLTPIPLFMQLQNRHRAEKTRNLAGFFFMLTTVGC